MCLCRTTCAALRAAQYMCKQALCLIATRCRLHMHLIFRPSHPRSVSLTIVYVRVCVCVCVLVVGRQTLSMWDNVRRGEHTWIFPHQVPLGAFLPACLSLLVAAVAPLERRKAEATRLSPQIGASNAAGFCKDGGARRHGVRDQRLKKSPCACRHACSCRAGASTPNSRRPSVQSVEHLC